MDKRNTVETGKFCTIPEFEISGTKLDLHSDGTQNGQQTQRPNKWPGSISHNIPIPTSSILPITTDGRLVQKHGAYNIRCWTDQSDRRYHVMIDLVTALIELKWRYVILLYIGVFTVGWIAFGLIWYGVIIVHEDHLHKNDTDWKPCLSNIFTFPDALLFSIDLQSTMGYGFGEIETECAVAVILFMMQCVFGVFVECIATGIVFSKLIRPKRRYQTILFSDHAVIFQRQSFGDLALQFRIGDMRRRCLIATSVSAVMVKPVQTVEGEDLPMCQHVLELHAESKEDATSFLLWPELITHVIDEKSPLFGLTKDSLLKDVKENSFEIIVLLEGTDDTTGMAVQLRTSYLPSEILFGCHMMPLSMCYLANGQCTVDYSLFNAVCDDKEL